MRAMLLSSSRVAHAPLFAHALPAVQRFVGTDEVLFLPYARTDHDDYSARVAHALQLPTRSLHTEVSPSAALAEARVVFLGGGNTFRLLHALQELSLLEQLRDQVLAGHTRYLGSSAGTVLASPTIRTTNDMPIVEVRSLAALSLLPFQINPHYDDTPPAVASESRAQRLEEFLEHSTVPVVALRDSAWIEVGHRSCTLRNGTGVLFERNVRHPLTRDADLTHVMKVPARFDVE